MQHTRIAFIGGGNMARSIVGGLLAEGADPKSIAISDPNADTRTALAMDFGVRVMDDNRSAVASAELVILAVKPQSIKAVCLGLAGHLPEGTLVVSIAAGISCVSLRRWLGECALVRAMPNTPALVQTGATGVFASEGVAEQQKQLAEQVLAAVGLVCWVDSEGLLDAVTAVSGSGPAYFFLMLESMVQAGVAQGLTPEVAQRLAVQTALGAAKLAIDSDVGLAELRRRVTSPGGTTEQAILTFEQRGLRETVAAAMTACAARAAQMATELGD